MDKNLYQNYQQNAVISATPEELVTMLYNRLIKDIKVAIMAVQKSNIEAANKAILHAQDILIHLMGTLNTQIEVGNSMMLMYDYMNRRLAEANIKKDREILQEIQSYAEEIKDTWVTAMKQVKMEKAHGA